jgi:hypothetical protein
MIAKGKVEMEIDGSAVHPTLSGIPVKLRVRNEAGRYDRHDPDKFRATREVIDALSTKGDLPGHEFRGNQYSDGGGGGGDRNSDEASDARYFAKEQKRADATISEIKDKIRQVESKIEAANVAKEEVKVIQSALTSIKVKKEILEIEHKASSDRMEALRREWETKFPNKPLPKFARRKDASDSFEKKILAEMQKHADIIDRMEALSKELDKLI